MEILRHNIFFYIEHDFINIIQSENFMLISFSLSKLSITSHFSVRSVVFSHLVFNNWAYFKFSRNMANRHLLIVRKFRNDSFFFCGIIKKNFGRGQKWPPSLPPVQIGLNVICNNWPECIAFTKIDNIYFMLLV